MSSIKSIVSAQLADLEEEHDYLLDATLSNVQPKKLIADHHVAAAKSRPAVCHQRPAPGPCNAQITRWYFLEKEDDCLQFPWGGCQGNDNNFMSLTQCRSACQVPLNKPRPPHLTAQQNPPVKVAPRPLLPPPAITLDISIDCNLPPDSGRCGKRMTRFYYNNGQCQRFHYSGCAGNKNNFLSSEECMEACSSVQEEAEINEQSELSEGDDDVVDTTNEARRLAAKQICLLPEDSGDCDMKIARFRWDSRLKECASFMWSGCGGNSNNFISLDKCRNRCQI